MTRMVLKRMAASALAGAMALALAASASAADRREGVRPVQPQVEGGRIPGDGLLGQLWSWLQALAGEEGGLIDPNGVSLFKPTLTESRQVDGVGSGEADSVGLGF
jgi:hypothetical protein